MRFSLFLAVYLSCYSVEAYRILCVIPIPSRSHHQLGNGIVDALLEAGHEVTWATPYAELVKPQNGLRVIGLPAVQKIGKVLDNIGKDPRPVISFIKEFSRNVTRLCLESELRDVVVKEQFDAVVTEWFFSEIESGYAAVQQVPWILLSSISVHPELEEIVDEVRSLTTIPQIFNIAPIPMSLWQRAVNVGIYGSMKAKAWWERATSESFYEDQFSSIAKDRGVPLPPLQEAVHNVSILLANSHPSFAPARSVPPNVIDIAGFHINENTSPLPKDLQDLMDSSKCVVYFSMGSVVKSSSIPEETRASILDTLGKLPCLVLWKYEIELQGAPKNVHVRKWMPQASILAHPKVKVFITHGGLLSTYEALHAGVPLLAIPIFGDQPSNAQRAVMSGFARSMEFSRIAQDLGAEVNEMLKDDRYYQKAQQISKYLRKRLVSPKKLISYYVELAIVTKGAFHLRSPSKLYTWYQRWMLDVILLALIILYLVYVLIRFVIITIKNKICHCKKQKVKTR